LPDSKIKNLPASIRQRLLNLAQERNDALTRAHEVRLERCSSGSANLNTGIRLSERRPPLSNFGQGSVIVRRAMRIFLAKGDNTPDRSLNIFREISAIEVEDDGLRLIAKPQGGRIKRGRRLRRRARTFTAFLEKAQIPIQIDIGFAMQSGPAPSKRTTRRFWIFRVLACLRTPAKPSFQRSSKRW